MNAIFQLNPITSYFVLFSIPEEITIYVTGRKFSKFKNKIIAKWSLGMKRGCQENAQCEISAESDNFILFSNPEEIAIYITRRKFSSFSKIF